MIKNKEEFAEAVPVNRSYGRRHARKLTAGQQALMDNYLSTLHPPLRCNILDIDTLRLRHKELWLEIGFGAGEHLVAMTQRYPDIGIIGAEPFMNGVARCLQLAHEYKPNNLYIFPDDVNKLFHRIPPDTFSRVDILFADPWPKKKHHKRRIINHALLDILHRLMHPGADLFIATDHSDYAEWIADHLQAHQGFHLAQPQGTHDAPSDWHRTRYQEKASRDNRDAVFFRAQRS